MAWWVTSLTWGPVNAKYSTVPQRVRRIKIMTDYAIEAMWLLSISHARLRLCQTALAVDAILLVTYFVWCWILV